MPGKRNPAAPIPRAVANHRTANLSITPLSHFSGLHLYQLWPTCQRPSPEPPIAPVIGRRPCGVACDGALGRGSLARVEHSHAREALAAATNTKSVVVVLSIGHPNGSA